MTSFVGVFAAWVTLLAGAALTVSACGRERVSIHIQANHSIGAFAACRIVAENVSGEANRTRFALDIVLYENGTGVRSSPGGGAIVSLRIQSSASVERLHHSNWIDGFDGLYSSNRSRLSIPVILTFDGDFVGEPLLRSIELIYESFDIDSENETESPSLTTGSHPTSCEEKSDSRHLHLIIPLAIFACATGIAVTVIIFLLLTRGRHSAKATISSDSLESPKPVLVSIPVANGCGKEAATDDDDTKRRVSNDGSDYDYDYVPVVASSTSPAPIQRNGAARGDERPQMYNTPLTYAQKRKSASLPDLLSDRKPKVAPKPRARPRITKAGPKRRVPASRPTVEKPPVYDDISPSGSDQLTADGYLKPVEQRQINDVDVRHRSTASDTDEDGYVPMSGRSMWTSHSESDASRYVNVRST